MHNCDTKSRIFREAAKLFSEKGYHAVSMRELSERADVTKPMIYYYFGNKEGIYKALIQEGLQQGLERIQSILNLDIPVKLKLVKLMQSRFQLSLEYPDFTKFFLNAFESSESLEFLNDFKRVANQHSQVLIKLIQQGVDSGEFGAGAKPEIAVEIFGAVISHYIRKQLQMKKDILSDQLAEDVVELLFKGLNE